MSILIHIIVPVIVAVLASSGLWAFLLKKSDKKRRSVRNADGLGA